MTKHDPTGRTRRGPRKAKSGKPLATNLHDVRRVPDGEPFTLLSLAVVSSERWQAQSINCRRFVDFLMVESMRSGGTANGSLLAPYDQLETWGIGRRLIAGAIEQAVTLGLVAVERRGRAAGQKHALATRYRLTFLPAMVENEAGQRYFAEPTWMPETVIEQPSEKQNESARR